MWWWPHDHEVGITTNCFQSAPTLIDSEWICWIQSETCMDTRALPTQRETSKHGELFNTSGLIANNAVRAEDFAVNDVTTSPRVTHLEQPAPATQASQHLWSGKCYEDSISEWMQKIYMWMCSFKHFRVLRGLFSFNSFKISPKCGKDEEKS